MSKDSAYTPGPSGDAVEQEELKLAGTIVFDEDEDGTNTSALRRDQLVEVTVRGYIGGIGEVTRAVDKREITVRTFSFKAIRLNDLTVIADPSPRPRRNGAPPIIPGQTSIITPDGAAEIERTLRDDGYDVSVTVVAGEDASPPEAGYSYGRASLNVGTAGDARVVIHSESGEVVSLEPAHLPDGPWNVPGHGRGDVLGLIDADTAAIAVNGVVLAIPTDDFIDGTVTLSATATLPEPPAVIEDPPPSPDELRADDGAEDPADRAPIQPGDGPGF